jgi:hypothetical protein
MKRFGTVRRAPKVLVGLRFGELEPPGRAGLGGPALYDAADLEIPKGIESRRGHYPLLTAPREHQRRLRLPG